MKYSVLLVLLVFLVGCGSPINPATPSSNSSSSSSSSSASSSSSSSSSGSQQGQSPATTPQTYDMLAWMTMDPTMASTQHMAGNHNPIYTTVQPDRFFWTKTGQGFPWGIQLYDNNYIYLWRSEEHTSEFQSPVHL